MPYLLIKFDPNEAPGQPLWKRTISVNFGLEGVSRVRLHSYQFVGIASPAPSPLFLRIKNQPTTAIYGNGPQGFPLYFSGNGVQDYSYEYNNQIVVAEGDNVWNNAHALDFEIVDFFGLPAIFDAAVILFEMEVRDPHWPKENGPPFEDEIRRKPVTELVTRNFLPGTKWMNTV